MYMFRNFLRLLTAPTNSERCIYMEDQEHHQPRVLFALLMLEM